MLDHRQELRSRKLARRDSSPSPGAQQSRVHGRRKIACRGKLSHAFRGGTNPPLGVSVTEAEMAGNGTTGAEAPSGKSERPSRYAWFVLALLTAINLVNYIDRQIVSALTTSIQADLGLNDEQFGYVLS